MSNPPRIRKRVGAEPSKFKRGVDGSGFITCEKCGFSVPAGAADVHDCKLDARIKSSLECHHTIDSGGRGRSQFRSRKHQRTEEAETQKSPKCVKKPKDPNRPKKPQTAFFVFMDEFRKKYKVDNADTKGVNKQGTDKWKSMTEDEKKPYFAKAHALKMEYTISMAKYLEEIRQANEEADSAEVGKIDLAAEFYYNDYPSELGSSDEDSASVADCKLDELQVAEFHYEYPYELGSSDEDSASEY